MNVVIIEGKEYVTVKDVCEIYDIPYPTLSKHMMNSEHEGKVFGRNLVYGKEETISIAKTIDKYRKVKKELR